MWIVPSPVFVARCHLMGGKLSSVQSVLTRPSVPSIPVYPSDWPNATVLQLLLCQRHNYQSWACSWLTKYYCTLYKHVAATVSLAQSSVLGTPYPCDWPNTTVLVFSYCTRGTPGTNVPLPLCYRHYHLFSACPVLTTLIVLWKENNLLLHHNPWYIFYCHYISIAHEQYVGIGRKLYGCILSNHSRPAITLHWHDH